MKKLKAILDRFSLAQRLLRVRSGFYLLAFEFKWAERLVEWALRKTETAKRKYRDYPS